MRSGLIRCDLIFWVKDVLRCVLRICVRFMVIFVIYYGEVMKVKVSMLFMFDVKFKSFVWVVVLRML